MYAICARSELSVGRPHMSAGSSILEIGMTAISRGARRERASSGDSTSTIFIGITSSFAARYRTTGSPYTTSADSARTSLTVAALRITSGPMPAGSPIVIASRGGLTRSLFFQLGVADDLLDLGRVGRVGAKLEVPLVVLDAL